MEPHELRRITALLGRRCGGHGRGALMIAGRNQGRRLVDRLLETRDMPRSIAGEVGIYNQYRL
jgi:hypothetical protein